jgi:hypothetical protein
METKNMFRRLLPGAVLSLACLLPLIPAQANTRWGMNDATIIYPLPYYPQETSQLITPQLPAVGGVLLPERHFLRLPPINQGEAKHITYQNLRVVAVRVDPCFSFRGECLHQVRLVWQPIGKSVYGSSTQLGLLEAKDAAVHSLYTLDAAAFNALLDDYSALRENEGVDLSNEPLQVHPVLTGQGLGGSLAQGLKKLLTKHIGEHNLWRVTAMSTFVGGDQWSFQGFNIREDGMQDIVIPRTQGASQQRFSTSSLTQIDFANGQLAPVPLGNDNLQVLLRNSRFLPPQSSPLLRELAASVARIENPSIHTPETMDCVSCHAAQTAGSVLFSRMPALKRDPQHVEALFNSTSPLLNVSSHQGNTQILRALGYFERYLILSRRVINETARVVERLNSGASNENDDKKNPDLAEAETRKEFVANPFLISPLRLTGRTPSTAN